MRWNLKEAFNELDKINDDVYARKEITEPFSTHGFVVQNTPAYAKTKKFIVARYNMDDDSVWFFGAWDDEDKANEVANDLYNSLVLPNTNLREDYNNDFKYDIDVIDSNIDFRKDKAVAVLSIFDSKDDNNDLFNVVCTADFYPDEFEYDWEPDGEPTYVPYGSQSVLYDNGKGSLEDVSEIDLDFDFSYQDYDGKPLSEDVVCNLLNISIDELRKLEQKVFAKEANDYLEISIKDYIMENSEEFRPDDEPDYDDYE